ncbi:hypothetical protein K450DRAFT_267349 [Umbelopsis ramanniana AG]|uniref:Uncharacterized protein n=1 Tax=Umbelopsis ramanniana AG TaxID=1314678 RepID=A0AAD5EKK9_UMBRA|nr:uncharacterized protein K450DRAFT_267349 [Umbelopsis ramanniana AG]KAI8584696.1 hypothetical protein K450DRAFT_267349 [Umbelopsis ramanniana AG]
MFKFEKPKILRSHTISAISPELVTYGYYEFHKHIIDNCQTRYTATFNEYLPSSFVSSFSPSEEVIYNLPGYTSCIKLRQEVEFYDKYYCVAAAALTCVTQYVYGVDCILTDDPTRGGFELLYRPVDIENISRWFHPYTLSDTTKSYSITFTRVLLSAWHLSQHISDLNLLTDLVLLITASELAPSGTILTELDTQLDVIEVAKRCVPVKVLRTVESIMRQSHEVIAWPLDLRQMDMHFEPGGILNAVSNSIPLSRSIVMAARRSSRGTYISRVLPVVECSYNSSNEFLRSFSYYKRLFAKVAEPGLRHFLSEKGYKVRIPHVVYPFLAFLALFAIIVLEEGLRKAPWITVDGVDPTSLTSLVLVIEGLLLALLVSTTARNWSWYDMIRGVIYYESYQEIPSIIRPSINLNMFMVHLLWYNSEYAKCLDSYDSCSLMVEREGSATIPRAVTMEEFVASGHVVFRHQDIFLAVKLNYEQNVTTGISMMGFDRGSFKIHMEPCGVNVATGYVVEWKERQLYSIGASLPSHMGFPNTTLPTSFIERLCPGNTLMGSPVMINPQQTENEALPVAGNKIDCVHQIVKIQDDKICTKDKWETTAC